MQYIPPFLSQIIDAVAFQGDPHEFQEDWLNWKADFEEYFARENDYSVSKEDAAVVQNLPPLLQQLEVSVQRALDGTCNVDDLVKDCIDFFEAHDCFFEEREKEYFVPNPPLDRLLKVSVAYIQDQAEITAVLKRAPDAALAVEAIHDLYLQCREELPEELLKGTIEGFKRAQKGLDLLAEHDENISKEVLEDAVFEIRSAGELLSHLPSLFRRFEEEQGSPIPVIGPILNTLREEDEEQLEMLREEAWPAFAELWETRQDGWLLDPNVAVEVLPAADQCIYQFSELLEIYPESEDAFWDSVEQLEEVFEQIRDNTLELDELPSSPYWPEAQLILNLLRGGAPLYAAHTLATGISQGGPDVPEAISKVGDALSAFVAEPDPWPLLNALKILKDDFELSKTSRACAKCNERMPLDAQKCPSCHAEVEKLSVSG